MKPIENEGVLANSQNFPEFKEWAKIGRLKKPITITEKIDGTNAVVYVGPINDPNNPEDRIVVAGSRSRWLTPDNDNFGFARWVASHKQDLMKLDTGYHYGEWWGSGIQRGYGLTNGIKRFSLFNVGRWADKPLPESIRLVPTLYQGDFDLVAIEMALDSLAKNGSVASPGFNKPEGIVIYHKGINQYFKYTLDGDGK